MEASVAVALVFLLTNKIDQNFDKSPHTHQKFDRLVKNLTIRQKISNGFDPSKFWFKPIFDIKTSYILSNFLSKYWCQNFDAKFWRFFWTCMGPLLISHYNWTRVKAAVLNLLVEVDNAGSRSFKNQLPSVRGVWCHGRASCCSHMSVIGAPRENCLCCNASAFIHDSI